MELKLQWKGGVASEVVTHGGHVVAIDGSEAVGGKNLGARPMELVLSGLMGCASIDVLHILKKMRVDIRTFEMHARAQRADAQPSVFEHIHLKFIVVGDALDVTRIEQAIELSVDKYCSVIAMLESVKLDWELVTGLEK